MLWITKVNEYKVLFCYSLLVSWINTIYMTATSYFIQYSPSDHFDFIVVYKCLFIALQNFNQTAFAELKTFLLGAKINQEKD